jgi:hypothetical protein
MSKDKIILLAVAAAVVAFLLRSTLSTLPILSSVYGATGPTS